MMVTIESTLGLGSVCMHMKEGTKYYPLYAHLQQNDQDEIVLNITEIERLLDIKLPATARTQRAWWSNRSSGSVQSQAWMGAGYHVTEIDLAKGTITFRKPGLVYNLRKQGDMILWTGDLVKAFREQMGWTQTELADKLGMRQQTISEWETGMYEPKRSTSKFLTMFAEQTGFKYGESETPEE
jgi:transcriptional regulator with XRE-family HTH domain